MPKGLLPRRNAREQIGRVLGQVGLGELQESNDVFDPFVPAAGDRSQGAEENLPARFALPDGAARDGLEERTRGGRRKTFEQREDALREVVFCGS